MRAPINQHRTSRNNVLANSAVPKTPFSSLFQKTDMIHTVRRQIYQIEV